MAEQPINSDQIIDPKLFDIAIAKANEFLAIEKELEIQSKANLAVQKDRLTSLKISNSKDLKEQAFLTAEAARELKNLETLEKAAAQTKIALLKVEQERIKTNRELAKSELEYNKQINKTAQDTNKLTSIYSKINSKLNETRREYRDLAIQKELNAKLSEKEEIRLSTLEKRISSYNNALVSVDERMGQHTRKVGNYSTAFDGLGNSVNQLTREMPAFANSVQTGFMAISNNLPMFFDQIKKIKDENKALALEGKKGVSALTQVAGAVFSLGSVLSIGVTLLTLYGKQMVEWVETLFKGEKALESITKANDAYGKSMNQTKDDIGDLTIQLKVRLGLITKEQGALLKNENERNKAFKEGKDLRKTSIEDLKKELNITQDLLNKFGKTRRTVTQGGEVNEVNLLSIAETNRVIRYKKGLAELNDQTQLNNKYINEEYNIRGKLLELGEGSAKKEKDKKEKELIDLTDRIVRQNILNESDTKQRAINLAQFEERMAIKEVDRINATQKQKQLLILSIQQDTINKLILIDEDYTKREQDAINKNFEEKNAIADRNIKATHKVIEDNRDFELWTLEQQYNEEKAKGEKANKAELIRLNQLILDKKALLIQARADEEKEGKTDFEKTAIQNKADIEIKKLKLDSRKKEDDDADKRRAEELKKQWAFSSKIIDAIAKAEAEKSKVRVEGFDRAIKDEEKNIETQRNLAQRGLKNTLAEEEARKIQLERQKEEEKIKEIKRQKALAFFKLFASYAEKDPNTALQNALKDTIIAEAVSAAFIDGTENVGKDAQFNGNKFKSGQDGYIAKFDGDERIINPEQNKMIGNLSNEALADLAYKHNNGLLDTVKYGVIQSNDFASNVANSALLMETMALRKEMQDVKQAIINKPVPNFAFDKYGDFIKETIEGGFIKRTTFKQDKIRL